VRAGVQFVASLARRGRRVTNGSVSVHFVALSRLHRRRATKCIRTAATSPAGGADNVADPLAPRGSVTLTTSCVVNVADPRRRTGVGHVVRPRPPSMRRSPEDRKD
jgi:hypothetical protein